MYIEFYVNEELGICKFYLSKGGQGIGVKRLKADMDRLNYNRKVDIIKRGREFILYELEYNTETDKKQVKEIFLDKKSIMYKCDELDEKTYIKFKDEVIKPYAIELNKSFIKNHSLELNNQKLLKHQQHIYNLVCENEKKSFALFMEMGTGKTFVSIALLIKYYLDSKKGNFKVLIVGPKDAITSWIIEVKKVFEVIEDRLYATVKNDKIPVNIFKVYGNVNKRREILNTSCDGINLYLISCDSIYNTITNGDNEKNIISEFDMCIADESQFMKTYNSKRSYAMHQIGDLLMGKPKLILSGTPISNEPMELWSQFRFLDSERVGNYFEWFKSQYMYSVYGNTIYKGLQSFISDLSDITYYMDKENVMKVMEKPEDINIMIDFSEDLEEYNKIKKSNDNYFFKDKQESLIKIRLKQEIDKNIKESLIDKCGNDDNEIFEKDKSINIRVKNVLAQYIKLQQFTGGFLRSERDNVYRSVSNLKMNKMEQVIDSIIKSGQNEKVVIFAQFRHELEHISDRLKEKDISHIVFRAEDDLNTREEKVDEFQNNNKYKIFLAQLKCGCRGITLTKARNMIYYSINFSYSDYSQSRARIFRIGQENKCRYFNLICKGTIDEYILNAVKYKEDMAKVLSEQWRVIARASENK